MAPSIPNLDIQQTLQQLWPLCVSARLRTKCDNVVCSLFGLIRERETQSYLFKYMRCCVMSLHVNSLTHYFMYVGMSVDGQAD